MRQAQGMACGRDPHGLVPVRAGDGRERGRVPGGDSLPISRARAGRDPLGCRPRARRPATPRRGRGVDLTARRPRVLPGALAMLPAVRTLGGVRADDPARPP